MPDNTPTDDAVKNPFEIAIGRALVLRIERDGSINFGEGLDESDLREALRLLARELAGRLTSPVRFDMPRVVQINAVETSSVADPEEHEQIGGREALVYALRNDGIVFEYRRRYVVASGEWQQLPPCPGTTPVDPISQITFIPDAPVPS